MIIDIVLLYALGHGGLENVIKKVYNGLSKKGHKVRLFLAIPSKYNEWLTSIEEIYYYDNTFLDLSKEENINRYSENYKRLTNEIGKPDIILCTHLPILSYICYLSLSEEERKKIPLISWIHGRMRAYEYVDLLKYSDYHLAISKKVGEEIFDVTKSENIYYIGNPVKYKGIKVIDRPKDEFIFLYLSRLDRDKRVNILLEALSKVKGQWRVEIFGDGMYMDILKLLAKTYRVEEKIKWNGWMQDPWDKIQEASATIITSNAEGFSMTTAESLVRGIPVISTMCGGPEDMIVNGLNGWMYNVENVTELQAILNNVVTGKYILPDQESCNKSIEILSEENVISNIEKILLSIKEEYEYDN